MSAQTKSEAPEKAVDGPKHAAEGDDTCPPEESAEAKALRRERMANRIGPRHPAHWQHAQWLADRGLDSSYDKTLHYDD